MAVGKTNKEWHLAHKMPRNPSEDERLTWHLEHAKSCACREIPPDMVELAVRRGLMVQAADTHPTAPK